jgi:SOS response regulatory protein OraA/RecX
VLLREELLTRGVPSALADEILSQTDLPSLKEALTSKMIYLKLRAPLQLRDATRLFRALSRLGYDEDAIQEEIEQLRKR